MIDKGERMKKICFAFLLPIAFLSFLFGAASLSLRPAAAKTGKSISTQRAKNNLFVYVISVQLRYFGKSNINLLYLKSVLEKKSQ